MDGQEEKRTAPTLQHRKVRALLVAQRALVADLLSQRRQLPGCPIQCVGGVQTPMPTSRQNESRMAAIQDNSSITRYFAAAGEETEVPRRSRARDER